MSTTKEEYDLLIAMLSAFKQLGGDAVKWSFPAWKAMSDECTSFFEKQVKSDKILLNFISELTALCSEISIDETEDALYKGVLLTNYYLLKNYNEHATRLSKYLYRKAELYGFQNIIVKLNDLIGECNMNNELDNIIVLNDENGNEVNFEFLDLIEYNGEEYVVLLPCDEADDAGEVVILKLEDTDDEDTEAYASVDDESVLNAVFEIFKDKFKDEFNFVD